ncbi:hypothetical protein E2C01_069008 [Portunus trituberculatus]|uniref:Uncharacterized protein n=1 Tax=Portunus trituberculatus TaxID=210409 RepID=A0A5B7HQC4_PORTR|nr:hypothetical protein [Portunus trituberculatus]
MRKWQGGRLSADGQGVGKNRYPECMQPQHNSWEIHSSAEVMLGQYSQPYQLLIRATFNGV